MRTTCKTCLVVLIFGGAAEAADDFKAGFF